MTSKAILPAFIPHHDLGQIAIDQVEEAINALYLDSFVER